MHDGRPSPLKKFARRESKVAHEVALENEATLVTADETYSVGMQSAALQRRVTTPLHRSTV